MLFQISFIGHLFSHLFEALVDGGLHFEGLGLAQAHGEMIGMILSEFLEEVGSGMMSSVMLLKIRLRNKELRAVTALDHILLLFDGKAH